MSKETKRLRYVNEVVGGFVLFALLLFAGAVILAGHAQGWLEGVIEIEARFADAAGQSSDEQGSFDLQEGNEVKIRSARAGHVKSIEPSDDGGLKAVIAIKARFHRYIRVDSVAHVKKKFGVAGDAFVEIGGGKGAQIEDGGTILCYKDEELMEIAQRALDRLEQAVVPMVIETTGVMSNANRIAAQVSEREGLVGTMISDPTLTTDVREAIDRLNMLIATTEEAVSEATRLIRGAQKSWLVRNHIPKDDGKTYLSPLFPVYGSTDRNLIRKCEDDLKDARADASASDVLRAACNLAMCRYVDGDENAAELLIKEAAFSSSGGEWDRIQLASVKLFCLGGDIKEREDWVAKDILNRQPDGMDYEVYSEYIAAAILCLSPDTPFASEVIDEHQKRLQRKGSHEAKAACLRAKAMIAGKTSLLDAGILTDTEVEQLAAAGLKKAMALTMARAGDSYAGIEGNKLAAVRYLVAGKSLGAQGFVDDSARILQKALCSSQVAGNEALTSYIEGFIESNFVKSVK